MAAKVADGRAKHIRARVAKALGTSGAKLETKSYGAKDYEQEKGQSVSKNRRVEFQIYKK
jgi:outer membrane protein OmpA-like peptidoglycan-associated protein